MIDRIVDFNRSFVAQKGYEQYIKDETLDTIRECIDLNHWLEGFRDTETSVRKTVKTIQTHPLIPKDVTVRGFIIDSVTGGLQEIH